MPRRPRNAPGGLVYHALNRATSRFGLFETLDDYAQFVRVMADAMARHPTRLLGYCVMPDHWHIVLWPREDGEMTGYLRWLTHTHAMRWHARHGTAGSGNLYRGRFKAFPVQRDKHLAQLLRYVERNPVRRGLVQRAEQWPWSSLQVSASGGPPLAERPGSCPRQWVESVNEPEREENLAQLRRSVQRGTPYGSAAWTAGTVRRLGLEWTLRPRGRPRKRP